MARNRHKKIRETRKRLKTHHNSQKPYSTRGTSSRQREEVQTNYINKILCTTLGSREIRSSYRLKQQNLPTVLDSRLRHSSMWTKLCTQLNWRYDMSIKPLTLFSFAVIAALTVLAVTALGGGVTIILEPEGAQLIMQGGDDS